MNPVKKCVVLVGLVIGLLCPTPGFSQIKAMLGYSITANAYAASMGIGAGPGLPGTTGAFQQGLYA